MLLHIWSLALSNEDILGHVYSVKSRFLKTESEFLFKSYNLNFSGITAILHTCLYEHFSNHAVSQGARSTSSSLHLTTMNHNSNSPLPGNVLSHRHQASSLTHRSPCLTKGNMLPQLKSFSHSKGISTLSTILQMLKRYTYMSKTCLSGMFIGEPNRAI